MAEEQHSCFLFLLLFTVCFLVASTKAVGPGPVTVSLKIQAFLLLLVSAEEWLAPKSLHTSLVSPTASLVRFLIAER